MERQNFIAVFESDRELQWLKAGLAQVGEVVSAEGRPLEDVVDLVDMTGALVVFVGLQPANTARMTAFIEGLLVAKPMLSVVAVGDGMDSDLVLAAMRAGARDFLTPGARTSELTGLVRRLQQRLPSGQSVSANHGRFVAVLNARPDLGNAFFAEHLALGLQQRVAGARVLLLDLGLPPGDSLQLLGLESSFSFLDAVRNLRRLDQTLIESAFPAHGSGLKLLAMPEEAGGIEDVTSAEIYLLLGVLKQHFTHVVLNLSGVPPSDFLQLLLSHAEQILLLVDQSVPSCNQNFRRLRLIKDWGLQDRLAGFLIDRYEPKVAPDQAALAKSFDLPLLAALPPAPAVRLRAANLGRSVFEVAPRDRYAAAVEEVLGRLGETGSARRGGLARLIGLSHGSR
ncbi:pilus assembly protein CpaE [Thioalkalivibrio nitratireducens]|nr:pilus assembly protein CpaE [Thioalkalivibrio nitratireducens]